MIGLDTNVLARYYIRDESDEEAEKQHQAARRLIESGRPLRVCKTVLLELEWVMRGYYGFAAAEILSALNHLLALPQVTVEDRDAVRQALAHCAAGLDLGTPCTTPATGTATAWPPSTTASSPVGPSGWGWCRRSWCRPEREPIPPDATTARMSARPPARTARRALPLPDEGARRREAPDLARRGGSPARPGGRADPSDKAG